MGRRSRPLGGQCGDCRQTQDARISHHGERAISQRNESRCALCLLYAWGVESQVAYDRSVSLVTTEQYTLEEVYELKGDASCVVVRVSCKKLLIFLSI